MRGNPGSTMLPEGRRVPALAGATAVVSGIPPTRGVGWPLLSALLGSVAFGAVLAAAPPLWVAPPDETVRPNPRPATAESLALGREAYRENCATCHGESGRGDGDLAELLDVPVGNLSDSASMAAQTDGALHWKIATGRFPMPSFAADLDEGRLWDVVNYVRTLSPPPRRP